MNKLNAEQIKKLKIFIDKINEVEDRAIKFDDNTLAIMTGTYKLIEHLGGGDPIKAAKKRLQATGSL